MAGKPENPPAFPFREIGLREDGTAVHHISAGMSMRDWFAGQALPAVILLAADRRLVGFKDGETAGQHIAREAYNFADAMIAERAKGQP